MGLLDAAIAELRSQGYIVIAPENQQAAVELMAKSMMAALELEIKGRAKEQIMEKKKRKYTKRSKLDPGPKRKYTRRALSTPKKTGWPKDALPESVSAPKPKPISDKAILDKIEDVEKVRDRMYKKFVSHEGEDEK